MKNKFIFIFILVSFLGATSNAKSGDLLNINFGKNFQDKTLFGSSADFWNEIETGSLFYLPAPENIMYDSEGNIMGEIVKWSSKGYTTISPSLTGFAGTQWENLMNSYILTKSTGGNVLNMGGIPAGEYYLFVYSQREKNNQNSLHFGANGVWGDTEIITGNMSVFEEGKNYIKLSVTVGADEKLNMSYNSNLSYMGAAINGIQLIRRDVFNTAGEDEIIHSPETDTTIMIGFGAALISFYVRKNYNTYMCDVS